ncbi:MAG: hypothetical protein WBA46_09520 [Thermomicrobiales bacterium]
MMDPPPANPRRSALQGGHWRPESNLLDTHVVVINESRKRLGIVDTTPPPATQDHISGELRNLRPKRERGVRGMVRRWMGWS